MPVKYVFSCGPVGTSGAQEKGRERGWEERQAVDEKELDGME